MRTHTNKLLSIKTMSIDIAKSVQKAMLGEVPSTLRYVYASLESGTLNFHAVFTNDATDEHLESASCVLTEVLADCPVTTQLNEKIERNSSAPWKIGAGENLLYLRYGELANA